MSKSSEEVLSFDEVLKKLPPDDVWNLLDTVSSDKLDDLLRIQTIHHLGHPDDLAFVRSILGRPFFQERISGQQDLELAEMNTREMLQDLEQSGWRWIQDGPGEGHFELLTGKRGPPPLWTTVYVWMLIFQIEEEKRRIVESWRKAKRKLPLQI